MGTTAEEARAARDAKLDALHERLTGAVEALVSGDDWRRALEFAARFRARSFNNTLLIWSQHLAAFEQGRVPEAVPSYVAGYKQWQSLGRQVTRGQPGYMIFAPVKGRFATATPQDALSWRRLGRCEKPKPGEVVRSRLVGSRPAYVWDVSQTAGDAVPERPRPVLLEGEAPEGLWDGLAALVVAEGFAVLRVEHEGMIGGANGLTDYAARTVAVRTNMDPAAQAKTLAHELAHVKLHGPDNSDATGHRGIGEVEAESVALMIGAAHGMDTSSYTIPYVSGWAGSVNDKSPAEVVQATGERVRKAAGLYRQGVITAPNVLLAGIVGSGKSSLAKSLYTRSIPFGKRVYVPGDPKGEHTAVAELVGGKAIVLGHGLSNRLNPLDEGHRPAGTSDVEWAAQLASRRRDLIGALAETVLDRGLSPLEHTAIDLALADAVRSSEVPILPMVVDRILAPNPADDEDGRLAEDGRMVGHALRRLVAGDLQGLFDGPSTVRFDPSLPMVSLDLSRVAENSTLISVLMTCSSAWMESALLDPAGGQRWVIYDEAWRLMQYPALLRRMDAQWRLARHYAPYYYWPIWPMIGTAVPALVLWVSGGSMANRSRPDDRDRRRLDRGR